MRNLLFILLLMLLGAGLPTSAQNPITYARKKEFRKREDSLKVFAYDSVNGESAADRFRADSQFIRSLVRTLKLPYSFYYPLDSL